MCKYLEDISSVTQIGVGVVEDAFREDGLLADERNPDSGTEAAVGHIVHSIHQLNDEVFHLVVGYDER